MLHEGEVVSTIDQSLYRNDSLVRCGKIGFAGRTSWPFLSVELEAPGQRVQAIGWSVLDLEQSGAATYGGAGGLPGRVLSPTGRTKPPLP